MISFLSKYVGKQYMSNLNSTISNQDQLESFFISDLNFEYRIETKKVLKLQYMDLLIIYLIKNLLIGVIIIHTNTLIVRENYNW